MEIPSEYLKPEQAKKVRDIVPVPIVCPFCNSGVHIAHHLEVYGKVCDKDFPFLYACENTHCGARVGMHKFTTIPLGTLANSALRSARVRAKNQFYVFKEYKGIGTGAAYNWLAEKMDIDRKLCHFGFFNREQCEQAYRLCTQELPTQAIINAYESVWPGL